MNESGPSIFDIIAAGLAVLAAGELAASQFFASRPQGQSKLIASLLLWEGIAMFACAAVLFVRRLWNFFLEDLSSSENDLPKELRAELISIGLWIMKEIEQIRLEKSSNFKSLIEVSENIRDGLK